MLGQDKNNMHPEDARNLFIFFVIAVFLYFTYDAFIMKPQRDAAVAARKAQMEQTIQDLAKLEPPEIIKSRDEAIGTGGRITIDSPTIKGTISLTGGRIDDIALKEYFVTREKKENVVILSPRGTKMPRYVDYGWVASEKGVSVPGSDTPWQVQGNSTLGVNQPVTLVWSNAQGLVFERDINLDAKYVMTVTQKVTNNTGSPVKLHSYGLVAQRGYPENMASTWIQHEGPIGYMSDKLQEVSYASLIKEGPKEATADKGWAGITEKYWLTALMPAQGEATKYSFSYNGNPPVQKREIPKGLYQTDFTGPEITVAPGEKKETTSHLFVGPKKVLLLDEYEEALQIPKLDLAVNFGWFWFFSRPFFLALHYIGEFTGNFGIAIIVMTIIVRMAVFPLTNASYRSFAKMKKVTPQINQLREIHGQDRAKLQQAIMELYQKEGVNPMAGCVPIFLQIPIFFALYKVLFTTIEMRHAPFFGWIQDLSAPDPTNVFNLFGLIPWEPPVFLHIGAWPCFMLVAMIIQKKLNPPPQDPIQRDMANYFPFVITYIMSKFASGLLIYWTIGAYLGVIQQIVIMRSLGVPIHLFGQSEEEEKLEKKIDQGPVGVHPLAQMAEDKVEDALFGEPGDDATPPPTITPPKPKKKKKK